MRVLLDTHAFLWWLAGDPSLSERAREVIRGKGNTVLLSAASAWEIAKHGQHAGALPGLHRDPFDRMLIAQAILEDCVLVFNESRFDAYGVIRLW